MCRLGLTGFGAANVSAPTRHDYFSKRQAGWSFYMLATVRRHQLRRGCVATHWSVAHLNVFCEHRYIHSADILRNPSQAVRLNFPGVVIGCAEGSQIPATADYDRV